MEKKKQTRGNLKESIAQAFLEMVVAKSIDSISVLDIVREVGVNKNSFYYHFPSKYGVAYWILRSDIASMLEENFDEPYLVFPEERATTLKKNLYPDLPHYVRVPTGARMLDQGAFFKLSVNALREKRSFYQALFKDSSLDNLKSYIEKLYYPTFLKDVEFIADGRYVPEQTRSFLAKGYLALFVGMLEQFVCSQELPDDLLDDEKNPFWNIAAESIENALRNHPITNTSFSFNLN